MYIRKPYSSRHVQSVSVLSSFSHTNCMHHYVYTYKDWGIATTEPYYYQGMLSPYIMYIHRTQEVYSSMEHNTRLSYLSVRIINTTPLPDATQKPS